jgi:hypothetical protein
MLAPKIEVFAASRERLREVAERLALRRLANLGGCAATWRSHEALTAAFFGSRRDRRLR